jgi:hypothetical protein
VQDLDGLRGSAVQAPPEPFLTEGTDVPVRGGLPLFGQGEDQTTKSGMLGSDALLAFCFASLELATR